MARVTARRRDGYTHDLDIDGHEMVIDEPESAGGNNQGPSPVRVLGASLAACTAITVEMYADRKGWDLGALEVDVEITYDGPDPSAFAVTLRPASELDEDQLGRLEVIAAKCPVHKALDGDATVTIAVEPASPGA